MWENYLLYVHLAAANLGLLLGPLASFTQKSRGWHTRSGNLYHWLVLVTCSTGMTFSTMTWEKHWYLFFIAIVSYAFALYGFLAAKRKANGWLKKHITGMLGSYIAMVTAIVAVNAMELPLFNQFSPWVAWLTPTAIGIPLIMLAHRRAVS